MKPGVAYLSGIVEAHLKLEDQPLRIGPGEDAVRVGNRTWLRQRESENGQQSAVYAAAEGNRTLLIEFACADPVCMGAKGDEMVAQIARTARVVP
jgi:hypothetical protein